MTDINDIRKKLEQYARKEEDLKVYSLLIKTRRGSTFLWLEVAYNLETAFGMAKEELKKLHKGESFDDATIDLFNHESAEELFNRADVEVKNLVAQKEKQSTKDEKTSLLMKKIIEDKDLKLFEKHRSDFSRAQVKFLEDKLNK